MKINVPIALAWHKLECPIVRKSQGFLCEVCETIRVEMPTTDPCRARHSRDTIRIVFWYKIDPLLFRYTIVLGEVVGRRSLRWIASQNNTTSPSLTLGCWHNCFCRELAIMELLWRAQTYWLPWFLGFSYRAVPRSGTLLCWPIRARLYSWIYNASGWLQISLKRTWFVVRDDVTWLA